MKCFYFWIRWAETENWVDDKKLLLKTPAGRAEKGMAKSEVAEGEWCGVFPQGFVETDLISHSVHCELWQQIRHVSGCCLMYVLLGLYRWKLVIVKLKKLRRL